MRPLWKGIYFFSLSYKVQSDNIWYGLKEPIQMWSNANIKPSWWIFCTPKPVSESHLKHLISFYKHNFKYFLCVPKMDNYLSSHIPPPSLSSTSNTEETFLPYQYLPSSGPPPPCSPPTEDFYLHGLACHFISTTHFEHNG